MAQIKVSVLNLLLCAIFGHDYYKSHQTRIDDFGRDDGIKVIICYRCGKPFKTDDNIEDWNQCINIVGTKAYNEISEIGIDNYIKKREKEGNELWEDF